ncbi:hypothetical protein HMPREF1352_03021, partial [Enterococcus faecium 511]
MIKFEKISFPDSPLRFITPKKFAIYFKGGLSHHRNESFSEVNVIINLFNTIGSILFDVGELH